MFIFYLKIRVVFNWGKCMKELNFKSKKMFKKLPLSYLFQLCFVLCLISVQQKKCMDMQSLNREVLLVCHIGFCN